jgi:hypothetical protein
MAQPLQISTPVGATTGNKPQDVRAVQERLNSLMECLDGYNRIAVNGRIDRSTIRAIRTFQRAVGTPNPPDGVIRPGSQLLKLLSQPLIKFPNPNAACQLAQQDRVRADINRRLKVVERTTWGSAKATLPYTSDWNYTGIVVHHAGNSFRCSIDPARQMLRVQEKHMGGGYVDVGYHYGIACSGEIYEGRDIRYRGEHVKNQNTGLLGVVLLADFTVRGEDSRFENSLADQLDVYNQSTVPTVQLNALEKVIDTLLDYFNIVRLGGHREYSATLNDLRSCPGDLVLAEVNKLRNKFQLAAP